MTGSQLEKAGRLQRKSWRRRHPRYRADFPLKVTALQEAGYSEIPGRCSDIGQGGIGAILHGEVPAGEVVSLELRLPAAAESFTVRAIVRYRRGFVHGFEFLGLSPEHQLAVTTFCASPEESE